MECPMLQPPALSVDLDFPSTTGEIKGGGQRSQRCIDVVIDVEVGWQSWAPTTMEKLGDSRHR
jgi:hypothetical protein